MLDILRNFGFKNAAGAAKQALVNADDRQEVYALEGGKTVAFNKSASAVIKASAGRLCRVSVVTAGSAAGAVHDCAATADAAAGNKLATIPNTVGVYDIDMPCVTGIVYVVGSGQVVTISYI